MSDDWDDHWERYAASASRNPAQNLRHAAILGALRARAWPADRLLDVGSGQGDFLARAVRARAATCYTGFELSGSGVRIASTKVPEAEFVQVDLFEPPGAADRFLGWASAAVCSDVIEHVDDPVAFLLRLRAYVADDGVLLLTVPGGPMSSFDRAIGHRRHFDAAAIRTTLAAAGFRVERVWRAGFPFFNLYRLVVILRGERLAADVAAGEPSALARAVMRAFDVLFRFNLPDAPFGWQIVAQARKA